MRLRDDREVIEGPIRKKSSSKARQKFWLKTNFNFKN